MESSDATDSGTLFGTPKKRFPGPFTGTGNRCGHDPLRPEFPTFDDERPTLIVRAIEEFGEFYWNPDLFPKLKYANSEMRQYRSEGRQACVVLMTYLLRYLDIGSMEVKIPADGEHRSDRVLDYKWIAKDSGYSHERLCNASKVLQFGNLLIVDRRYKRNSKNQPYQVAAVKRINPLLFSRLGLNSLYKHKRAQARKEYEKRRRQQKKKLTDKDHAGLANIQLFLKNAPNINRIDSRSIGDVISGTRPSPHKTARRRTPAESATLPAPNDGESLRAYTERLKGEQPEIHVFDVYQRWAASQEP